MFAAAVSLHLLALAATDFSAIRPALEQAQKVTSVVIRRDGKIVYETYLDNQPDALRDTRSATKSIAGALIGIAVREGKLRKDARVLDLLPQHAARLENRDPRKSRITVEDLLTMSSPLECDDWNDASRGNEERMYLIEDWGQFILNLPIRGRMRLGENPPPPPDHGRHFSYCTGGVFLLSEIIEAATKQRADRYAREKLFNLLGIGDVQWMYSPLGIPQTGGGLRLSTRSLARFAELYLLEPAKQTLLDPAWVKASTTAQARIDDDTEYGYLFWIKTWKTPQGRAYPSFYMTGNGGNKVVVIPSLRAVIAITSTNFNNRTMHEQTDKLLTNVILPALDPK